MPRYGFTLCILLGSVLNLQAAQPIQPPPGEYRTSWVGNSFGGDGGSNGEGYWVQNGADEIEVTPDGTVIAGTDWDEAGRCVGLYKDGRPNRILLKQEGAKETAWGWNTGNHAIAVEGNNIYVANTGKRLLRFTWTPGDLDSAKVAEDRELPDKAEGLNARGGKLTVVYKDRVEVRSASDFKIVSEFPLPGVKEALLASDGSVWAIAGEKVVHLSATGHELFRGLEGVAKPTALAFDPKERLIVCDDGPDQQVKIFEVENAEPKLAATFGERGGLFAGRPGESAPLKFYAPRGAGMDAAGNLYVALGFNGAPVGTLVLRSFSPEGKLRWELANHAFVDTYGFDPDSDGQVVYSRTAVFDLDLSQTKPGAEWKQRATTVNHIQFPDDPRISSAMTVQVRHLEGRRLLYGIGQYGGGYRLYTFDEPDGYIGQPVGHITSPGETWAWSVADNGDIWHGDAPERTIRRHAFLGWSADGKPRFETEKPESWPCPEDFEQVRRILYDRENDRLYISGYLKGETIDSWGVVGKTLRRYDGWRTGKKEVRWTVKLPLNPEGDGKDKPLSPQSLALAGDYLFVTMVKPDNGKQHTHILSLQDGTYVGSFVPGPEVGGNAGWADMPYAVQALRRKNGEYLILVEEDWRGKNLLYRWTPPEGKK